MTPSAVSHQVKSLEEFLGLILFERKTRQIELTRLGEVYLESITKAFIRIEAATERVIKGNAIGELKLAINPTFLERWLLPRFGDFTDHHPDIEIEIFNLQDEIDFTQSDIDMAIYFGEGQWDNVNRTHLRNANLAPVCAPQLLELERVMDPEDLLNFRLLQVRSRSDDWLRWFNLCATEFHPSQGFVNFPSNTLAIQAAIAGVGVALADPSFIQREIDSGELMIPIDVEMELTTSFYLVSHRDRVASQAMLTFEQWLTQRVGKEGSEGL